MVFNELMDEKNAAAFLDVAPITLRQWRFKGIGPVYSRIGRLIRYELVNLRQFVVERRRLNKVLPTKTTAL